MGQPRVPPRLHMCQQPLRGAQPAQRLRLVTYCKIVEHWDVLQPLPERSINANGTF